MSERVPGPPGPGGPRNGVPVREETGRIPVVRIADTRWTPRVNLHLVRCPCGGAWEHRADRWRLRCPKCGATGHLGELRERWVKERKDGD